MNKKLKNMIWAQTFVSEYAILVKESGGPLPYQMAGRAADQACRYAEMYWKEKEAGEREYKELYGE